MRVLGLGLFRSNLKFKDNRALIWNMVELFRLYNHKFQFPELNHSAFIVYEGTLMQTPGPNPVVGCFLFFVCPSLQATPNISSFNHGWAIYQPVGVVFYHSQPLFPRVRPE